MNGLRVGNERVSFPFFILQRPKEHLNLLCKDNAFLMKTVCFYGNK